MTKRVQSERWLSLLGKVLTHCEDDTTLAAGTNDETFKRALGWLDKLMNREALSPKQAANFIDSIRKRVPGRAGFSWDGSIQLTAKQIKDEKANDTLGRFREVNRRQAYATNLMMEAVRETLATFDFTDIDQLVAFRAHIAAFDYQAAEQDEEPEIEPASVTPVVSNPVLDDLMRRRPHRERFPGNSWGAEREEEACGQFSTRGY